MKRNFEQVKKSFEEAQREADSIGKSSDMTGNEINNLYIKLSEFRSEIGNSDSSAQDADEQLEMPQNQRKQLSELAEQYGKEKDEISDGIRVLKEKSEELRNKFVGLTKLYNDKQKKLSDYKKKVKTYF